MGNATSPPTVSKHDDLIERAGKAEALLAAERYEEACVGFTSVIREFEERLREAPDDVEISAHVAGQLNNLALCLGALRRFSEAAQVLEGAAEIFRALAVQDRRWVPEVARTMQSQASALADGGVLPRALQLSTEVVQLRQNLHGLAQPGPAEVLALQDLAAALRLFAHVRTVADVELNEAHAAIERAIDAHIQILSALPTKDNVEQAYVTERVQIAVLNRMGRHMAAREVQAALDKRHLDVMLPPRP